MKSSSLKGTLGILCSTCGSYQYKFSFSCKFYKKNRRNGNLNNEICLQCAVCEVVMGDNAIGICSTCTCDMPFNPFILLLLFY